MTRKLLNLFLFLNISVNHLLGQDNVNKFEQDRQAILSMTGCYQVNYDFAETFAGDTAYKYHDRYHAKGNEYVFVLEDSGTKIVLQHLLIVKDTSIIKHWRQDWLYENPEVLQYVSDNEWHKTEVKNVKGQWTQKVYQVDDGPRYEGNGTWIHVDGRHFWESTCDAPLPRRENTKRNDYNVVHRKSHIEITSTGWYLEQDNEKIVRSDSRDSMLCREKGMESFKIVDGKCEGAIKWWSVNKDYWAEVRAVWNEILSRNIVLKMEPNPGDAALWYQLLKVEKTATATNRKKLITEAIESFLKKS